MTPAKTLVLALGMELAWQSEGVPPVAYSAKPTQGVVVDAGTGEPLRGVIVVAQWVLHEPGKGSWRRLHVFETTTDSAGRYLVPGWGPKRNTWYPWTRLRDQDPKLSFFMQRYSNLTIQNNWERNESMRFSEWDGKTIKLQRFTGTSEQWAKELSFLQTDLAWGDVMDWRQISRMTLAILEELGRMPRELFWIMGSSESLGTTVEEVRKFVKGQE